MLCNVFSFTLPNVYLQFAQHVIFYATKHNVLLRTLYPYTVVFHFVSDTKFMFTKPINYRNPQPDSVWRGEFLGVLLLLNVYI